MREPLREQEANPDEDKNRLPVSLHQREISNQIDPLLRNNGDDQIVPSHDRQSTKEAKESCLSPSRNDSASKPNGACGRKEKKVKDDPFGLSAVNASSQITNAEDERLVRRAARGGNGGAVAKGRGGLSGNGRRRGRLDLAPQLGPKWRQQRLSRQHPHFDVGNGPSSSPSPHFDEDNGPSSSPSPSSLRVGEMMPSSDTSKCHERGRLDREDDDASGAAAAASELELIDFAGTRWRDPVLNSGEGKIFVFHASASFSISSCIVTNTVKLRSVRVKFPLHTGPLELSFTVLISFFIPSWSSARGSVFSHFCLFPVLDRRR